MLFEHITKSRKTKIIKDVLLYFCVFAFLLVLQSKQIYSQPDSLFNKTTVDLEISTLDFQNSKEQILNFINNNDIKIINQKENKNSLKINFILTAEQYDSFKDMPETFGRTISKDIVSNNNYTKLQEKSNELNYLKQKNESYKEYLTKLDEKAENYSQIWKEQQDIEEKIFKLEQDIQKLNKTYNTFNIELKLLDEATVPEETGISFVNMPGIEYSILKIDEPNLNISANQYNGYLLKYLFTRGKSYFSLGAYKAQNRIQGDTNIYSELFLIGFGQDFYSRYFGKGSNQFLNLYSGYSIGYMLVSSNNDKTDMFYVAPSIGLEIYKNKYILIDTKVNYFVPLKLTRNLRGISFNASFNFAF